MTNTTRGAAAPPIIPGNLIPLDALEGLTPERAIALAWELSPLDADRRAILARGLVAWVNCQEGSR